MLYTVHIHFNTTISVRDYGGDTKTYLNDSKYWFERYDFYEPGRHWSNQVSAYDRGCLSAIVLTANLGCRYDNTRENNNADKKKDG